MSSRRVNASDLFAGPGTERPTTVEGPRMITVKTDRLLPNPHNPRDEYGDLSDLETIADIQQQSLLIVTRAAYLGLYPDEDEKTRGKDYIVVNGCRRHMAAVKWGRQELFCLLDNSVAESRAKLMRAAYDENIRRRNFDAFEDAKAVMAIVSEYPSAKAAAEAEGWSTGYISQRNSILKLSPEVQQAAVGMPLRDLRAFATKVVRAMPAGQQLAALEEFKAKLAGDQDAASAEPTASTRQDGLAEAPGFTTVNTGLSSPESRAAAASSPEAPKPQDGLAEAPGFTTVNTGLSSPESRAAAASSPEAPKPQDGLAEAPGFTTVNTGLSSPESRAAAASSPEAPKPQDGSNSPADPALANAGAGASQPAPDPELPGPRHSDSNGLESEALDWQSPQTVADVLCRNMDAKAAMAVAEIVLDRLTAHFEIVQ